MTKQLHPQVTFRSTDEGGVLLDRRTGAYFQLNRTGCEVLQEYLKGRSHDEIVKELQERYRSEAGRVAADVTALLDELATRKLFSDE